MRFRTAAMLLTLAAFALRAYGLHHKSFWLDEVDAISMAGEPLRQQVRKLAAIGENGPLFFILFKGWIALAGTSEFGARYLSCGASTLAVPLVGALARRLTHSAPIAIAAAALAAASPFYVWYAQDAKMYPLYAALALAAQYALLRALSRGGAWWWVGYAVASSFALYVHLFAALQIGANTLVGLLYVTRRRWRSFALATAALVLPYVPIAVWQAPVLAQGARVGYQPVALPSMVLALGEQLTWHLDVAPPRSLLVPLLAVIALGVWHLLDVAPRAAAAVGIWLVAPLLAVYALQFTVPVFRDRYLIPLLAPLLIACAAAVCLRPAALALPAAAFMCVSWLYGMAHRPPNPDYRAAAAYVAREYRPGQRIGFLAEYAERPFGFYYRRDWGTYEKANLPYTNYPGTTEQDGLAAAARALRAGETLWIVRWEDWFWDARDLTTQFLRNRGARETRRLGFSGLIVTQWVLP
ncbi:MAG TPA: glycosyltransferase family 39 protein [Chloroflexota bacterium]|nr:glycosyltransferase family 39 protein [Chloroflexota bacterium]